MTKTLNITEAIIASLAGVSTDGYQTVERTIQDKIVAALRKYSAFATHEDYQLAVTAYDEKSAVVFSMKDRARYKVDFEMDNNDEPRIIKITPLLSDEIPIREQLNQRLVAELFTEEEDLLKLEALNEQERKEASERQPVDQLIHRLAAGLITDSQYFEQRDRLLLEQHKERGTRRLLNEQQCDDDCDCRDCHLEGFKEILEARVAVGTMTRAQADSCYANRCAL